MISCCLSFASWAFFCDSIDNSFRFRISLSASFFVFLMVSRSSAISLALYSFKNSYRFFRRFSSGLGPARGSNRGSLTTCFLTSTACRFRVTARLLDWTAGACLLDLACGAVSDDDESSLSSSSESSWRGFLVSFVVRAFLLELDSFPAFCAFNSLNLSRSACNLSSC